MLTQKLNSELNIVQIVELLKSLSSSDKEKLLWFTEGMKAASNKSA